MSNLFWRRLMKILHELSTATIMGAMAAELVMVAAGQGRPLAEVSALREAMVGITRYVVLPSLAVVLLTGVLAIAIHRPFHDAGWAWVKAVLGISVFEGTLGGVMATARDAAALTAQVAAGQADHQALDEVLRHEWGALWMLLFLSAVNIVLGVWRPKLLYKVK